MTSDTMEFMGYPVNFCPDCNARTAGCCEKHASWTITYGSNDTVAPDVQPKCHWCKVTFPIGYTYCPHCGNRL